MCPLVATFPREHEQTLRRQVDFDDFTSPTISKDHGDGRAQGKARDDGSEARLAVHMRGDSLTWQVLVDDDLVSYLFEGTALAKPKGRNTSLGGTTQGYAAADKLTCITQGGNAMESFTFNAAGATAGITQSGIGAGRPRGAYSSSPSQDATA
jgi:hypothetical protein